MHSTTVRLLVIATAVVAIAACAGETPVTQATPGVPPTFTATDAPTPTQTPPATSVPTRKPTLAWHTRPAPAIPAAGAVGGVAARGGLSPLLVAVGVSDLAAATSSEGGNEHLGAVWISPDGTTWQPGARIETARMLFGVAYGASRFVAVGAYSGPPKSAGVALASYGGGSAPGVWASADGHSWTATKLHGGIEPLGITFGDAGFMVLGWDEACTQGCGPIVPGHPIWMSPDGLAWNSGYFSDGQIGEIAGAPGTGYVAVGFVLDDACQGGRPMAWNSADGQEWSRGAGLGAGCGSMRHVVAGPNGYLAIGTTAGTDADPSKLTVSFSVDGRTWNGPHEVAGASTDGVLGIIGETYVLATAEGIWEFVDGPVAVLSSGPASTFNVFGGGIGLRVGDEGGTVSIPEPAK